MNKAYLLMAAQKIAADFMGTFKAFPPRQKSASFTVDVAVDEMHKAAAGG
jgi:arylsulfatase